MLSEIQAARFCIFQFWVVGNSGLFKSRQNQCIFSMSSFVHQKVVREAQWYRYLSGGRTAFASIIVQVYLCLDFENISSLTVELLLNLKRKVDEPWGMQEHQASPTWYCLSSSKMRYHKVCQFKRVLWRNFEDFLGNQIFGETRENPIKKEWH